MRDRMRQLRRRAGLFPAAGCVLALGIGVPGALAAAAPAPSLDAKARAAAPQRFASCAQLVRYGRRYLAATGGRPSGTVLAPAASTGTSGSPSATGSTGSTGSTATYSTTNDQEPGVDEPDAVKTDGSTIFAVERNQLYAVDVSGGTPKLVGSLDLGPSGYGAQLLLSGTRLLVIAGGGLIRAVPAAGMVAYPSPYYLAARTTLTEVDVSNPAAMHTLSTATIDGSFVAARQNGATARIVISSAPRVIAQPGLRNRAGGYLPSVQFHSAAAGRSYSSTLVRCGQVARPAQFSGLGLVSIVTFDIGSGLQSMTADALMADAQVVYGSTASLYIASQRWIDPATRVARLPSSVTTQIDRFDATDPSATPFLATGEVPGYLLNQFSMSESGGYLRVATTSAPQSWDGSSTQTPTQSYLTVLATSGERLVPVGQLAGLGAGERIYSVRFIADTAYVVTFRQVDPLYTIDLSNPTAPRVTGQLELAGYSSYLQPLGPGLLLGIGQAVGQSNEPSGAQLELLDVSVPGQPRLIGQTALGQGAFTAAQSDPHAFLYWAPSDLAVLPVQSSPVVTGPPPPGGPGKHTAAPFSGALAFHIDASGISQLGTLTAPSSSGGSTPPITRALVAGNMLYTVSAAGIAAASLDTLAPAGFAAFPAPPPPPPPIVIGAPGPVRPSPPTH